MEKTKFIEWGDPILDLKSKPVPETDIASAEVKRLVSEMFEAIDGVGVGLAACQLGHSLRIIVIAFKEFKLAAINPKIVSKSKGTEDGWEGNLCMPGLMGLVRRQKKIKVSYFNEDGKKIVESLEGFSARVFQHEYEQLEGKNFIYSMPDPTKLITNSEYAKRFAKTRHK